MFRRRQPTTVDSPAEDAAATPEDSGSPAAPGNPGAVTASKGRPTPKRSEAEKRAIQRAMTNVGGNLSRVADLLGISRPTLYDLLEKYDLKKPGEAS